MGMEDDFLLDAEDDVKAVEFIKNYLPQDLKDKFTDEDLYYILDLIAEYYTSSECLDAEPDEEGYIDIDLDEIVKYIVKEAQKDDMGPYEADDVFFVLHFTILNEKNCRNVANTETTSQLVIIVYITFTDNHLILIFFCQSFYIWSDFLTRSTPCCPKVNYQRFAWCQQFFKIAIFNF